MFDITRNVTADDDRHETTMADYGRIDPFSFAASRDIESPVSIRMSVKSSKLTLNVPSLIALPCRIGIDGDVPPTKYSTLLDKPQVRHIGSNTRYDANQQATLEMIAV